MQFVFVFPGGDESIYDEAVGYDDRDHGWKHKERRVSIILVPAGRKFSYGPINRER
jgi:hypothetical protein